MAHTQPTLMFSQDEAARIQLKALEQAIRAAGLAKADPAPLLPVEPSWPFRLTEDDKAFLRSLPYPISPA